MPDRVLRLIMVLTILKCLTTGYSFELEYNFITEHPVLTFWNRSLLAHANFTTTRYGRRNPIYYVNVNVETKVVVDSSVSSVHFSIFEFLSNEYRPSFVELHFSWCNFVYKDTLFGDQLRRRMPPSCPHPPGKYHFTNMTVPSHGIPKGFPFNKGRIFCNVTYLDGLLVTGYIDLELKPKKRAKKE